MLSPNTVGAPSGAWDSIHVFEAAERGRTAHYKLTSTIMLHLVTQSRVPAEAGAEKEGKAGVGEITLSGSMTRQVRS